jgi:hypothetical protein
MKIFEGVIEWHRTCWPTYYVRTIRRTHRAHLQNICQMWSFLVNATVVPSHGFCIPIGRRLSGQVFVFLFTFWLDRAWLDQIRNCRSNITLHLNPAGSPLFCWILEVVFSRSSVSHNLVFFSFSRMICLTCCLYISSSWLQWWSDLLQSINHVRCCNLSEMATSRFEKKKKWQLALAEATAPGRARSIFYARYRTYLQASWRKL